MQRMREFGEVPVGVVDLGGLGEVEREGEARRVAMLGGREAV